MQLQRGCYESFFLSYHLNKPAHGRMPAGAAFFVVVLQKT